MSVFSTLLKRRSTDPLDVPLVQLTRCKRDAFTRRKAFQGTFILGAPGTCKTTSSGRILAQALLRDRMGFLVPCVKASEPDRWLRYAHECGRSADVRRFSPGQPWRFNFLEHEARQPGVQVDHLIDLIETVTEKEASGKGDNTAFWQHLKQMFLRNALALLLDADESVTVPNLYALLNSAPETPGQLRATAWQERSYLFELMRRAGRLNRPKAAAFWASAYLEIHPETRRSAHTSVLGLLDTLAHGAIATLFSETSNLTPDDVLKGKVVILDFPELVHGEAARVCALVWMQCLQRALNRRVYDPSTDRGVASFVDEYPQLAHRKDVKHSATAREQGHAVVRICQSLSQVRLAFGNNQEMANAFAEMFGTLLFHANIGESNEWAARLIGKHTVARASFSGSNRSKADANASVSESREDSCPADVFTRLRCGGPSNRYEADAVAFVPGHRFPNGKTWQIIPFSQT